MENGRIERNLLEVSGPVKHCGEIKREIRCEVPMLAVQHLYDTDGSIRSMPGREPLNKGFLPFRPHPPYIILAVYCLRRSARHSSSNSRSSSSSIRRTTISHMHTHTRLYYCIIIQQADCDM